MMKAAGKSDWRVGTRILLEAISKDKIHLARFVLDALDGEIVDSKTEGARTPLICSVLLPEVQTRCKFVELLLQRGASVNFQDDTGRTALSYACEEGYLDAVKILVRHNADPEVVDAWGNTALMYAAAAGHAPVVEFLVRSFKRLGLRVHRQNKVGNSAAEVAKFLGHTECVFALTSARKSHDADVGAPGRTESEKFDRKVGHLVKKLEVLHTDPRIKKDLLTMDSIEEFDMESGDSSPPQEQLSAPLSALPPLRVHDRPAVCKPLTSSDDPLPPLVHDPEPQQSVPHRNTSERCAKCVLDILLTPILANKSRMDSSDISARRFHLSYYEKRFSLPTSILSPTPPERAVVPLRKTRTVRRRAEDESFPSTPTTTAFSALGNKLLRRFISPEFKRGVKESEPDALRFSRSETFPQCAKHPQVGGTPSVDSISSVKCEFDFDAQNPREGSQHPHCRGTFPTVKQPRGSTFST